MTTECPNCNGTGIPLVGETRVFYCHPCLLYYHVKRDGTRQIVGQQQFKVLSISSNFGAKFEQESAPAKLPLSRRETLRHLVDAGLVDRSALEEGELDYLLRPSRRKR